MLFDLLSCMLTVEQRYQSRLREMPTIPWPV